MGVWLREGHFCCGGVAARLVRKCLKSAHTSKSKAGWPVGGHATISGLPSVGTPFSLAAAAASPRSHGSIRRLLTLPSPTSSKYCNVEACVLATIGCDNSSTWTRVAHPGRSACVAAATASQMCETDVSRSTSMRACVSSSSWLMTGVLENFGSLVSDAWLEEEQQGAEAYEAIRGGYCDAAVSSRLWFKRAIDEESSSSPSEDEGIKETCCCIAHPGRSGALGVSEWSVGHWMMVILTEALLLGN